MVLNIKAFLEKNGEVKGEIRRFQVPSGAAELYQLLSTKVAEVFCLPENGFRMFWQDSDGDFVTFSSTVELMEAVKHSPDGVLRLFIKPTAQTGDKDGASSTSSQGASADKTSGTQTGEEKVLHPGVVCDGCEGSIYGPRYKCMVCFDYDLCSACEEKGIHPEHDKLKIVQPTPGGGPAGFMPPHFRRWMHRFMKKAHAGHGPCPAGASASTSGQATGTEPNSGSNSGPQQDQGAPTDNAYDDYLQKMGANIAEFLDPFGIDVTYEVHHGGKKSQGHCNSNRRGAGRCGATSGMWCWDTHMFGNGGGCTRMPQGPKPNTSSEGEQAEKPAEKPASTETRPEAEREEVQVSKEEEETTEPKTSDNADRQSRGQSPNNTEEDWTMLNEGETTTDGSEATAQESAQQREGLYPNLKVTQAVEMMKAMGFNDDGGWLTRLLETTDGDIAHALDTLKLGAQQAGRLG